MVLFCPGPLSASGLLLGLFELSVWFSKTKPKQIDPDKSASFFFSGFLEFSMSFVSSVKRHLTSAKTVVVAAVAGAAVHAHAIETTAITAAAADVATVGGAVFAVYVGAKVFVWVRKAL